MLRLGVTAVRAAASYLLVATAIVIAVAALSLMERAGSGAVPILHGPTLATLLGVVVPAALMVALTLSAPTVRVPMLNLLLAVALVLMAAELLPVSEGEPAGARSEMVAPSNLIYRGENGAQALVAGSELPQQLRRGTSVRPRATLWLPARATPVSPREPLRHRADVDLQVATDGLRTADGEAVAPPATVAFAPSASERLPGAEAWRAEQLVGNLATLARAPATRGTIAGRALTAAAIALLFFGVRLLLHASYWLAANLLFAIVALRVLPGIIVAASESAIPDLIGFLPPGIAERLVDHALAAGAVAAGVALLLGELLVAPPPGRSLGDSLAGRRGPAPAATGRRPGTGRQDAAAAAATARAAGGAAIFAQLSDQDQVGADLDADSSSSDELGATAPGSGDLKDLDLTDLSDAPNSQEDATPELADPDLAEPDPAVSEGSDELTEINFGDEEFDIDVGEGLDDVPDAEPS